MNLTFYDDKPLKIRNLGFAALSIETGSGQGVNEGYANSEVYINFLGRNYQEDGSYKVTVGCEVTVQEKGIEKDWTVTRIPAGKYARFTVYGDMVKAVAKAWAEIWEMNLNRTWTGDFEEYVDNNMTGNAKIYIYIAIA